MEERWLDSFETVHEEPDIHAFEEQLAFVATEPPKESVAKRKKRKVKGGDKKLVYELWDDHDILNGDNGNESLSAPRLGDFEDPEEDGAPESMFATPDPQAAQINRLRKSFRTYRDDKERESDILHPHSAPSQRHSDGAPSTPQGPRKGGIWPSPFPGYKGLFTYEVKEGARASDQSLGNGLYLWMLEILPGTVEIGEPENNIAQTVDFTCQMKKKLISLPDDAGEAMKGVLTKYIIEQWSGKAEIDSKVFVLDSIGPEPIDSTIEFDGLPLPRIALAGKYEMELLPDDSVVKAIHVSWMEFAKLTPDEASGFMFRVAEASPVCPVLRPAIRDELDRKLQEAAELLHGSRVYQREIAGEKQARNVRYWPTLFGVSDISVDGTFNAELELAIDYLVCRDDVFEYIIRPSGWRPRWQPNIFETQNAHDLESLRTVVRDPTLKVLEGGQGRELRAEIIVSFRGTFEERFELQSFPFDVQPLHVKLSVEQDELVEMERVEDKDNGLSRRLQKKWGNTEWFFLDLQAQHAHQYKTSGNKGMIARLYVSCRVQRHARSYLIRIIGVILLICFLSVCIFVIDASDDLPDMVGHAFMMLLTLTTYSLVVGDILPNLGYLTVLDQIILISFAFLALLVLQITWLGWVQMLNEELDEKDLQDYARNFAFTDLVGTCVVCIGLSIYVNYAVIAKELRKKHGNPAEELDLASSKTQTVGRFSTCGVHTSAS